MNRYIGCIHTHVDEYAHMKTFFSSSRIRRDTLAYVERSVERCDYCSVYTRITIVLVVVVAVAVVAVVVVMVVVAVVDRR